MELSKITFSDEQQEAFKIFNQGENIFLTGPGGTGKTALIKHIFESSKYKEKHSSMRMTGCAAVLL